MSRIRISEKYGVNPSMAVCFFCNEENGEIVLPGRIDIPRSNSIEPPQLDVEAPRRAVWNKEPCDKCKEYMAQGVILISVRDGEEKQRDNQNPYRTGGWCVVRDEAIKRMITPQALADDILKKRVAFIPNEAWRVMELPGDLVD